MPISLVRVDDRLIHGQVVESWIPHLDAELVVVAADAVAEDQTQKDLMELAMPEGTSLSILTVDAAAAFLRGDEVAEKKTLVLAPGPQEVVRLLEGGAAFTRVNIGGLHYSAGRVQLGRAIFVSQEDKNALRRLGQRGMRIEGRALPSDEETDVMELLGVGK